MAQRTLARIFGVEAGTLCKWIAHRERAHAEPCSQDPHFVEMPSDDINEIENVLDTVAQGLKSAKGMLLIFIPLEPQQGLRFIHMAPPVKQRRRAAG